MVTLVNEKSVVTLVNEKSMSRAFKTGFLKQVLLCLAYSGQRMFRIAMEVVDRGATNLAMHLPIVRKDARRLQVKDAEYKNECQEALSAFSNLSDLEKVKYGSVMGCKYPLTRQDIRFLVYTISKMGQAGTMPNFVFSVSIDQDSAEEIKSLVGKKVSRVRDCSGETEEASKYLKKMRSNNI
eukprot:GHVS01104334.1.p2 GENE.GHVS01104334.1~~GHVS01104334.1.p2  ORF type:complete len:182 (+),score=1.40 GHVS01104334.1:965-1510(+)